ncbi:hypothetical protein GCM10010106_02650 [Thermopolyspora flexuosa]|jgi:CrcB protein|uniref:Fluoride-specific ion channel FluC n=1 Tax=Thermopolyspora flexuosa TaxID=103836 RepID=A0A543IYA4_9ACTN|nr:fluoride efflux transporter CrcB [Thermopolyspora flexuosa]TQM75562.1 camphor resistance protein CrcB [Thermopolyspora flexuosa]GGM60353.1 hypothetical protein GCM10010106_02650 [Thermopolyspora flexuosa]
MSVLLVGLGAALGAPLRYLVDRAVQRRFRPAFPWGTFIVNVAGSFLLGLLAGLAAGPGTMAYAGAGFCGGLTTYSTFGYETLRLLESGRRWRALLNVAGSVAAGLAAAWAGLALGGLR